VKADKQNIKNKTAPIKKHKKKLIPVMTKE
jgi:hypothetical protein